MMMIILINFGRLLSKRDVDLIVTNGSPFLFKHASNSLRRMHAFINDANGGVSI